MRRIQFAVVLLATFMGVLGTAADPNDGPYLFQDPTISQTELVFAFAGNLWRVPRSGGDAGLLTTSEGNERHPRFSPDGQWVAFTGDYDGNTDVYLIPRQGGIPRRITHHPVPDEVVGWSPDGRILFRSSRTSSSPIPKLFAVGADGGFPEELPLPGGVDITFAGDGKRFAYVPTVQWQPGWKRYRGGQTSPIWISDLESLKVEEIPRQNSNESAPMWVDESIYFLSDRNGPKTLFRYDIRRRRIDQVFKNDGLDLKAASVGPGAIAYEQFGSLFLYDLKRRKSRPVDIRLAGDLPEVRPHWVNVNRRIANADISPSGMRAVFEARGEILTVPASKGDIRNLTKTPGIMERSPAWSPDGRWIAYFSDASGEYELHLAEQSGLGEVKTYRLEDQPTFYYSPTWSPDSGKIAFIDKRLHLWVLDLAEERPHLVDTTPYFSPAFQIDMSWSPDSRWLTYQRQLESHLSAVFAYSLESEQTHQITDGMSDARHPVFDKSGKYLYFTASTDTGLTTGWLNMTSVNHPVTRSVYVTVLRSDLPSPLAPESDEEEVKSEDQEVEESDEEEKSEEKEEKGELEVEIEFDRISQRILALPMPARNYLGLSAGKEGTLYVVEGPQIASGILGGGSSKLHKFDLKERKPTALTEGITGFWLAAKGDKLLYRKGQSWAITSAAGPIKADDGALNLSSMQVYADPPAEWKQMYEEAWRLERDFFYDAGLHGLNYSQIRTKYAPYLANLGSRNDLNYLFDEMLGELTCGHVFVSGGDLPQPDRVPGGLLGADFKIENGRYRIVRVYDGENWNPSLRAPLTQPGVDVRAGAYLLEINGQPLSGDDEVFRFFEATAGKSVQITVGPNPDGSDSREVTVVPTGSESGLRNRAWVEGNRRKVDELSGGRLAYVYLPDTAGGGFTYFNRYFFSQVGREGAVVDERFNQGGLIADYIIDYLRRPLRGYFAARDGANMATPVGAIYGPKAMLINEYAGSGGDMMPWLFRREQIGPLIGKRTWGGLVGMAGAAPLMDGGFTGAPQSGFWNPDGTWDVENHGVAPDIEVEMDPAGVRDGRDPQLERAVAWLLEELEKNPLPKHKKPEYPNYQRPPR